MHQGITPNHGWLIKDAGENDWSQRFWYFHSKEGVGTPPVLVVEYEVSSEVTPIQVTASKTNISCNGTNDGTASVTVTGGNNSGYTYFWSPAPPNGQGTNSISNLSAGTYTVTVTDALDNTISESLNFEITEPQVLSLVYQTADASCGSCADGLINIIPSGGTAPYQYRLNGGAGFVSNSNFVNLQSSDYDVLVRDANGCEFLDVVRVGFAQLDATIQTTVATCGLSDGSALINASGGFPPYNYDWVGLNIDGNVANSLSTGSYSINITDQVGTTINLDFEINTVIEWGYLNNIVVNNFTNTFTSSAGFDYTNAISKQFVPADENGKISFSVPNNGNSFMFGFTGETVYGDGSGHEYVICKYPGNAITGDVLHVMINRGGSFSPNGPITKFPRLDDEITIEKIDGEIRFYLNGFWVHTFYITKKEDLRMIFKFGMANTTFDLPQAAFCSTNKILSKEYFKPERQLSSSFVKIKGTDLFINYNKEYASNSQSILKYQITNWKNEIVYSDIDEDIKIQKGPNKISINCIKEKVGGEGYYILTISSDKGEKSYLRFKVSSDNTCN